MAKESYEVALRRIMCIFVSIESFLVCLLVVSIADGDNIKLVEYHEQSPFSLIEPVLVIGIIFIGAAFFCWRYKGFYLFWDGVHAAIGAVCIFLSIPMLPEPFFLVGVIIALRMCVYCILILAHKK